MRILTRYILGEILSHAFIGCALFTFVLFMQRLPQILETVVRNSSSFSSVLEIFLYSLPNIFLVTIPMSVLVGVLLGLSRLAADSEVTAMRASGLGVWYFVRVAGAVAVAGTALGLLNSLLLAPLANQGIEDMGRALATSQASYEIQPRVFYEDFRNLVIYVQDVRSGTGASNWRKIFIADLTDASTPKIITAASATVVDDSDQVLLMRLRNGTEHDTVAGQPDQYNISTFRTTDRPFQLSAQSVNLGRMDTPMLAMNTRELLSNARRPNGLRYRIEWQKRFAYPAACLVLMLVGVPLGISSRRGGKSMGFVFTIALVFVYYILSYTGIAMGKEGKLPVLVAVWLANGLFAVVGLWLLRGMATGNRVLPRLVFPQGGKHVSPESATAGTAIAGAQAEPAAEHPKSARAKGHARYRLRDRVWNGLPRAGRGGGFPMILDDYVLREFLTTFFLVLSSFVMLLLVFTFLELLGDILRNHIHMATVGEYLINLTPSMIYQITPLSVLIAVLVTFGVFNRTSELTAMKATGISLYRVIAPLLAIAALLALGLFAFDQYYLPKANRRQEALHNIIKGRPPQTYLNPEQHWIFGMQKPGDPGHIFYYQFFDPVKSEFANLSVFEFDPASFALTRRIFAARAAWNPEKAAWVFENGWVRDMDADGARIAHYNDFQQAGFAEVHEAPSYFLKESLQSQEMNYGQLDRYIRDLRQSGFDTMRLSVELQHKLAYPLVTIVMAVLAVPFALSMGKRGSLTGIAVAIGVALAYWVVAGLFEAMGNVNYLPAGLAAWSPDVLFGIVGGYLLLRTPT